MLVEKTLGGNGTWERLEFFRSEIDLLDKRIEALENKLNICCGFQSSIEFFIHCIINRVVHAKVDAGSRPTEYDNACGSDQSDLPGF